jgi:hypothetical protein
VLTGIESEHLGISLNQFPNNLMHSSIEINIRYYFIGIIEDFTWGRDNTHDYSNYISDIPYLPYRMPLGTTRARSLYCVSITPTECLSKLDRSLCYRRGIPLRSTERVLDELGTGIELGLSGLNRHRINCGTSLHSRNHAGHRRNHVTKQRGPE